MVEWENLKIYIYISIISNFVYSLGVGGLMTFLPLCLGGMRPVPSHEPPKFLKNNEVFIR